MADKKKVGCVVIMHPGQNNYGTSLQGFATIKKVADIGYDYEIIRYKKEKSLAFFLKNLIGYIRSGGVEKYFYRRNKKKDLKNHREYRETRSVRTAAVDKFKCRYFDSVSHVYNGYAALEKGSENYGVIFVGSDQVWGPLSLYTGFYNLLFVNNSVPKFSYASSFGVSEIFPWQKKGVAGFLNRMDMIGVREQRGKEIVEELTGKKATVVCDPTFLLTKDEWMTSILSWEKEKGGRKDYNLTRPYILSYVLGEREDVRTQIKKLREESGLKVVNLPHIDNYHAMDDNLGDINLFDVDPFDFIRLIEGAEYVVTDSFHGSVFSILMHKKFITFYRKPQSEKGNTNSRIDSLFNLFGLSDRLFNGDIFSQIKKEIDYNYVDDKVDTLRQESIIFLAKGLQLKK